MKMLYPSRNRSQPFSNKRIGIVVLILVVGALFFSWADGFVLRLVAPLWHGENVVAKNIWEATNYLRSFDEVVKENQALKEQLTSAHLQSLSHNINPFGNTEILKTLSRSSSTESVAASVLARPPETPYDVIIIDRGTRNAITVGDTVRLSEGAEIGKVIEAFDKTSRVILYSAWGQKTNAVLERDALPVTMSGRGGGGFEFTVPREVVIVEGDRILSPFTEASLVGVVEDVEASPTDSFKKVLARGVVHPRTLQYVIVEP
jgi:cell shape-determining protein MreC